MSDQFQIKRVEVKKRDINLEDYKLRSALESDYTTLYKESTMLVVDGVVKVIYLDLDEVGFDATNIVEALKRIKYETNTRTGGLKTTSRIFGFSPRVTVRKDFCSATSLAKEAPKEHKIVTDYAKKVSQIYKEISPEIYSEHEKEASKVLKNWKIEDSPFTSGIINKNNPLKYHFDTGNFTDVYSCMLGFKHNIAGGYLACPEYDCAFEIKNNSLHIFDGQNILHGVTPFKQLTEDAFRYTIVYYSLKSMWACLPVDEEVIRIRKLKTEREFKRAEAEAFKNVR